jgi:hypothetical protein
LIHTNPEMPRTGKSGAVTKGTELPAEKMVKETKDGAKISETTKESLREKAALAAAVKVEACIFRLRFQQVVLISCSGEERFQELAGQKIREGYGRRDQGGNHSLEFTDHTADVLVQPTMSNLDTLNIFSACVPDTMGTS